MEKSLITYKGLINNIGDLLQKGRRKAFKKVNPILVETYWNIGRQIVEFEQNGKEKAEYGSSLLKRLSKDLKKQYGKGFSRRNLLNMRNFYLKYKKWQTVSADLSWSHYSELLSVSDDLARSFYEKQCIKENWSVRELRRQINSSLFERLALSKDKESILKLAQKGQVYNEGKDIIKDPYIFEFLNLPQKNIYLEKDVENKLIDKMGNFLLELGQGFAFINKQFRITLNNTHFYVDLVFTTRD